MTLEHQHRHAMLIAVIYFLGFVGVGAGIVGMVGGLAIAPDSNDETPFFDSEYRFLSAIWFAVGIALCWSVRRPRERALVTRAILAAILLGGVSRVLSIFAVGWPYPAFTVAMLIELTLVPIALGWHYRYFPPKTSGAESVRSG